MESEQQQQQQLQLQRPRRPRRAHQANDDKDRHQWECGAFHEPSNWPARSRSSESSLRPRSGATATMRLPPLTTTTMMNGGVQRNPNCDTRGEPSPSLTGRISSSCDHRRRARCCCCCCCCSVHKRRPPRLALVGPIPMLVLMLLAPILTLQQAIIIDHHQHHRGAHHQRQHSTIVNNTNSDQQQQQQQQHKLAHNFQPASLLLAQNRSINFTRIAVDELTGTIYVGATNWLLQVSGRDLRVEQAVRTGPTTSDSSLARDCSTPDCQNQLVQIELDQLMPQLLMHSHNAQELHAAGGGGSGAAANLWSSTPATSGRGGRPFAGATMHTGNATGYALLQAHRRPAASQFSQATSSAAAGPTATTSQPTGGSASQQSSAPQQHNNYNKILAIDYESRHLIACGSLNQGACRRHQLGNLANFSELIPLPVASDDEHSSTVALIAKQESGGGGGGGGASANSKSQPGLLYVAATNSRLGPPNREMVPAISARSLDWSSRDRAMQIIEHSFTDLARVDIAFGLRDYYLVNYVHAFQHNNFIYFATVQRKSPLLQLEEWGYVTRLARLCANDLSFQSYAEMTLECSKPASTSTTTAQSQSQPQSQSQSQDRTNYNLLQDAHLIQAGRQLQQQLNLQATATANGRTHQAVLVGAFSQSRDHTARSSQRSAICLFPLERIEQRFQENIDLCYNGTIKSRSMDYIAGSVNDCPTRQLGQSRNGAGAQSYCNEPVKLNGSLSLVAEPIFTSDSEMITSITATLAPTSPVNIQWPQQQQQQQQQGSSAATTTSPATATATANGSAKHQQQQTNSIRQHQVLIAGTSDGRLKRFVVVAAGARLSALEFDSVSLAQAQTQAQDSPAQDGLDAYKTTGANGTSTTGTSPVLADMQLIPATNPQLVSDHHLQENQQAVGGRQQFVLAMTAERLVKLRINSCKASRSPAQSRHQTTTPGASNSSIVDDCLACSQLQDPFCGWCANLGACTTRDECISSAISTTSLEQPLAPSGQHQHQQQTSIHWTPFDSIRCSNYQPISPKNVPIQAEAGSTLVDVNVRLNLKHKASATQLVSHQLAAKLAQAQFFCHFDYLSLWNRTGGGAADERLSRLSGATTKAAQARMNLHAGTVAIGCPMPVDSQRPILRLNHHHHQASISGRSNELDHARVRLSVRLGLIGSSSSMGGTREQDELLLQQQSDRALLEQVLGMRPGPAATPNHASASNQELQHHLQADSIERELTLYDCSLNTDCRSCLSSGSLGRRWSCAWCPLSGRCTFNASHPDYGCAASAVASTTPHSAMLAPHSSGLIRGSHLTGSLDRAQTSLLSLSIDKLDRCPRVSGLAGGGSHGDGESGGDGSGSFVGGSPSHHEGRSVQQTLAMGEMIGSKTPPTASTSPREPSEILVPNNVRRSVQVPLARPIHHYQPREKRVLKLECLVELEGAKARFSARLLDNSNVVCQESLYSYQTEVATQRAQLSVILNDNQVIETTEVILYKCHLFGVNPPAIASSVAAGTEQAAALTAPPTTDVGEYSSGGRHHHSSASWATNLGDLLSLLPGASGVSATGHALPTTLRRQSDCSLCLNIDRKYQCAWCSSQCRHTDQCQELPASTCPPPRIDSIHPTSGPLEGGTLLTIEGSNLGSNEREIQDKIQVGGEQCQLVMYSVSTRIVCKTGPSVRGPQAATVFVGNRAGVTSAHEKFLYKAVHLADVNPRIGPVSGGTRLVLSGTNLNIGSRAQIFLDDIPCALDSSFDATSGQIACITGPNLLASSSMRVKQLTLQLDNSTHLLPFPFTYQPDPIITSIEPAESFLSGGRVILIRGQHLSAPQSIRLLLYLEHRPSVTNSTVCQRENDTCVICLTPGFSRADLLETGALQSEELSSDDGFNQQQQQQSLSYYSSGVKLKMALLMDDVKSGRYLDEYYHHLPHYLAYYDDPKLYRLPGNGLIEFRDELVLMGDNLQMRQLDQDIQISIGPHVCRIKSIQAQQIVVEPPPVIAPVYDFAEAGRRRLLVERPLLPILALVGANLRFELGHMQYSSSQYSSASLEADSMNNFAPSPVNDLMLDPTNLLGMSSQPTSGQQFYPNFGPNSHELQQQQAQQNNNNNNNSSAGFVALVALGLLGFVAAISGVLMFAMVRFKQVRAKQREYKRIQLQMGSLDMNNCHSPGSVFASGLFDKIHLPSMGELQPTHGSNQQQQQQRLFANQQLQHRTMDYANKGKPLYQFFQTSGNNNNNNNQQPPVLAPPPPPLPNSFAPSPLTDISSLVGSSPNHHHHNHNYHHHQQQQQQQAQQHVLKLNSSGQVVSSTTAPQQQHQYAYVESIVAAGTQPFVRQNNLQPDSSASSSTGSSSGSSPSRQANQQRQQPQNSSARNFNWTQEAPSTIVPYAVIEACNLTLEGKNAIKEFL